MFGKKEEMKEQKKTVKKEKFEKILEKPKISLKIIKEWEKIRKKKKTEESYSRLFITRRKIVVV